jgi:hypothetical protein
MVVTRRVEAANVSDWHVGARLLAGLHSGFPWIRTVMSDAGYESRKLARELKRRHGWRLHITKRRQRAFKVVGLSWIVGNTPSWLFSESSDYVSGVQTPKRRPVQRERIVLNLDRCRKFVALLERRVDNKADPLLFRRSWEKRFHSIALGDRTVIQVDHFGNALKREADL